MLHPYRCILILLLVEGLPTGPWHGAGSLPSADDQPSFRQRLSRDGGNSAMPARRHIFGIGVGFERSGTAQGVSLSQVLPDSPAERAGLAAGTVIAEINGVSTVGRTDEECVRMVRESAVAVKLKFLDPATLSPRTITIRKESIFLSN